MSDTLVQVQALARRGSVRISAHGYDELAEDDIFVEELIAGVDGAQTVEDYPDAAHGSCVLVLQADRDGRQFTWSGVSRAAGRNLLHWLPLIVLIRVGGLLIL